MSKETSNNLQLNDDEFTLILGALYGNWDRLRNDLSAGPSDENEGWAEDEILWAIRANQELLVKMVEMRPDYRYLVTDAIKRLV